MRPRSRWSLTWGLVGGMTVLVAGLGSRLTGVSAFSFTTIVAVAVVITAVTTVLGYLLAP